MSSPLGDIHSALASAEIPRHPKSDIVEHPTPPADDVREVLARHPWEITHWGDGGGGCSWRCPCKAGSAQARGDERFARYATERDATLAAVDHIAAEILSRETVTEEPCCEHGTPLSSLCEFVIAEVNGRAETASPQTAGHPTPATSLSEKDLVEHEHEWEPSDRPGLAKCVVCGYLIRFEEAPRHEHTWAPALQGHAARCSQCGAVAHLGEW